MVQDEEAWAGDSNRQRGFYRAAVGSVVMSLDEARKVVHSTRSDAKRGECREWAWEGMPVT